MQSFCHALTRRKKNNKINSDEDNNDNNKIKLARVLNLFDLTALGVGSTLGLGAYVLAGSVAYEQAGPAVVLSFVIAAIASAFAGICYAEFAARVPKAGSAYIYSYITIGEFVAFTIGWNLILEYVIGTASVARGLSGYIDALIENKMSNWFRDLLPIDLDFMAKYPDLLAFTLVILVGILLSFGVKESSNMNIIFTLINLATIIVMIVAGAMNADPANWKISKDQIPAGIRGGEGGFMPYGLTGVMAGAAKCFYGFVGFDCVATTGEEAKNPQRNIPIAIVLSLIIIFLSYFGVSTVLTMMWPYYLQNPTAPFPYVFEQIGWITVKWIVTIGAIFALCTNLLGAMFPLPRVLYAMSLDGIFYKIFKKINRKTQTPLIATLFSGLLSAIMAAIFDLHQLIDMMSIGTLIAYTIVSLCVLLLRYDDDDDDDDNNKVDDNNVHDNNEGINNAIEEDLFKNNSIIVILKQIVNFNSIKQSNRLSKLIIKLCTLAFLVGSIGFCVCVNQWQAINEQEFEYFNKFYAIILIIISAFLLLLILIISRQPQVDANLMFKVPFVPWVPCFSVLINMYLMFQLDLPTWIRFIIWGIFGYFVYFTYGIRHSNIDIVNKTPNHDRKNSEKHFQNIMDVIRAMPQEEKKGQTCYVISK